MKKFRFTDSQIKDDLKRAGICFASLRLIRAALAILERRAALSLR